MNYLLKLLCGALLMFGVQNSALALEFTGVISLPDGVTFNQDLDVNLDVDTTGGNDTCCGFTIVKIAANQSSAPFTLTIPDDASNITVRFGCFTPSTICQNFLFETFYTPDGFSVTNSGGFAVSDPMPSPNLVMVENPWIEGNINLPSGTADADISVSLWFVRFNAADEIVGGQSQSFTIAAGNSSVPYIHFRGDSGIFEATYAKFFYRINGNSSVYENEGYYTPDGIVVDGDEIETRLDLDQLKAIDDITLIPLALKTISGDFTLPGGAVAKANLDVIVTIFAHNADGSIVTNTFDSSLGTILAGQSSLAYTLTVDPHDAVFFRITYGCSSDPCEYFETNYFTPNGVLFNFQDDDAFFPVDDLPASADLVLQNQLPINGTVIIDAGAVTESTKFNAVINGYSDQGVVVTTRNEELVVAIGESDASFVFDEPDPASFYTLSFECSLGCVNLQSKTYYRGSISDNLSFSDAAIPAGSDSQFPIRSLLDTRIRNDAEVSGVVSLPSGSADGDITASVQIELYDNSDAQISIYDEVVVIRDGDSNVPYSLIVPAGVGSYYTIRYGCELNCGALVERAFFTPEGTEFLLAEAHIPIAELPSIANLELPIGQLVSATITLDKGVANGDASLFINLSPLTLPFEPIDYFISTQVLMLDGESSVNFNISIPPAITQQADAYYFEFMCSDCGQLAEGFLLTDNGVRLSAEPGEDTIAPDALFDLDEVIWPTGRSIAVTLNLPSNAVQNTTVFASLSAYDSQNNFIGSSASTQPILTGQSSAQASLLLIPEEAAYYTIRYGCSSNCNGLLEQHYYTPAGARYANTTQVQLSSAQIPDVLNLQIEQGRLVNFELRLPPAITTNLATVLSVTVIARNASGQSQGVQQFRRNINDGEASSSYAVALLNPADTKRYDISFECVFFRFGISQDCSIYQGADPSYQLDLDANNLPDPIILQLLEVQPTAVNPDAYEVDDDISNAKLIKNGMTQFRTLHESSDSDYIRIDLDDEITQLIIQATSDPSSGNVRLFLLDENEQELANDKDELIEQELLNIQFSHLQTNGLAAGTYYILVTGFTPTTITDSYNIRINYPDENDSLCVPIIAKNGAVVLVCL